MNPKTQKKLVELGFTEDKPGHFTLSKCGYIFNAYMKSEKFHTIWMTVLHDNGWTTFWPLPDQPEAVEAGMEWFNEFVDLNVSRKSKAVESECNIDKTKEEIMHNEISEEDSSILNYAE